MNDNAEETTDKKKKAKISLRLVSLAEVCSDRFQENSDNTILRFIILHIRKAQSKLVRTYSSRQSKWNISPDLNYDRIITCADLKSEKGSCFCFIYSTQRESDFKLQAFKLNNCGVGEIGEVFEPLFSHRTLASSDMPILEHKLALIHKANTSDILKNHPMVNYIEDSLPNFGTRFFHLRNLQVRIQNLTMEDPICTGFMCDRQEIKTSEKISCGCLVQSDGCNVVASCNLFFYTAENKFLFSVRHFRSWVFTKLLCGNTLSYISNKNDFTDLERLLELREHMKVILDYVNCLEGWNIVGWFRVGMIQDAADAAQDLTRNTTDSIGAETVSPHICRLWPSAVGLLENYTLPSKNTKTVMQDNVAQGELCCDNCRRCSVTEFKVEINIVETNTLNFRRKLCLLNPHPSLTKVFLCQECNETLAMSTESMNWRHIWAPYIWKLLIDNIEEEKFNVIWKWIPKRWRSMWTQSLVFECKIDVASIESSESYFSDVTLTLDKFKEDLASMKLAKLKEALNQHCYTCVKCPWGCDEFLETCTGLPFYGFISAELSKHVPNIKIPLSDHTVVYGENKTFDKTKKLVGIRPDYPMNINFMLNNPQWPIQASICIIAEAGPQVLVCPFHKDGSATMYFHVPSHPLSSSLPSIQNPKLSHAIITPKTVETIKLHKYSNTYQLVSTEGNFSGMDSCYITQHMKFDSHLSRVSKQDEILFLNQRQDMRYRLQHLMTNQELPYDIGQEKLKAASTLLYQNDIIKTLQGSTYLSLFDSLLLEKQTQEQTLYDAQNYKLPWLRFVTYCHPSNNKLLDPVLHLGKTIYTQPRIPYIWVLGNVILNNNILWNLFSKYGLSTNEGNWGGWLLKYLSKAVFDKRYSSKVDPRYERHINATKLHQMIEDTIQTSFEDRIFERFPNDFWTHLHVLLKNIPGVKTFQIFSDEDLGTDTFRTCLMDSTTKFIVFFIPNQQTSFTESNIMKPQNISGNLKPKTTSQDSTPYQLHDDNSMEYFLDMFRSGLSIPLQFSFNDGIYETCFIGEDSNISRLLENTRVLLKIRRPFYDNIRSFWNLDQEHSPILSDELTELTNLNFNMMMYVKLPMLTNIQRDYLYSMGNECGLKCPFHHKYLITCPYGHGILCHLSKIQAIGCHRKAAYICPINQCTFAVCKTHKKDPISVPSEEKSSSNVSIEDVSLDSTGSSNSSAKLSIDMEVFPNFLIADKVDDFSSVNSSTDNSLEEPITTDHLFCGTNDNVEEEENSIVSNNIIISNLTNDDDVHQRLSNVVLPTTDTARIVHWIEKPLASSIQLSVLLNKHLHVLIRRNYELKASKRAKGFLERIVATTEGNTVPLLYPESVLFPQIFFHQQNDGSIDGSIPSSLWNSNKFVHSFGYASLTEHMRNRIMNSSLRCSTEPSYLFFAFDVISNSLSHDQHPQIILSRGYEHMLRNASIHGFVHSSFEGNKDMIDSKKTVQELAAFLRDHEPTYFYTHTCNVREHFGVAPLQLWIDLQIEQLRNDFELSDFEYSEMVKSYNQQLVVPLTRSWYRAGDYFMKYICESPEKPLGHIKYHWRRWEDNDKSAALPHQHAILCTSDKKNNPRDLENIRSRVVCSSRRAIHPSVLQKLFDAGLLSETEESIQKYYSYVKQLQEHGSCSNRKYSCHRRTGLGKTETECRVVHHGYKNPTPNSHSYVHISSNHTTEAKQILEACQLLQHDISRDGIVKPVYLHPMLVTGKYFYPAEQSEHLIPFNPFLFASHFSSDCLEICDRAMSSHYLAKYNALIDKSSEVYIHAGQEHGELITTPIQHFNTKITSSRFYENQLHRQASNKSSGITVGRKLALPQAIALMLQIPQVITNTTFEHIPTVPLEQRPGILIKPLPLPSPSCPFPHYVPLNEGNNIPAINRRDELNFPPERKFNSIEQIIIQDTFYSPDSIDKITLFSIRPPELRFVRNVQRYYQWFVRCYESRQPVSLLQYNFFQCGWVNGIGHHIQVRPAAIPFILSQASCPMNMKILLYSLLYNENERLFSTRDHYQMKQLFLSTDPIDTLQLPTIVLPPIKPTNTNRFLIHLLLSLGSYSNEAELFNATSIIQSFRNANLLPFETLPTIGDVLNITKQYVEEQLLYIPSGTVTFDRYIVTAFHAIKAALLQSQLLSFDMPSFLYTSLVFTADSRTIEFRQQLTHTLIETLASEPGAPSTELLYHATKASPLNWQPTINQLLDQSNQSYAEHVSTSTYLQTSIDNYISAATTSTPSVIIIGGPGTGKTFQLKQACLYALSKGLNVLMTSIMSERSILLGGRHLHYFFCVPVRESNNVHHLTEAIIRNLNHKPIFLHLLQTNDLIAIDEGEFASSEFLNALDNVLRYVRKKNTFFGGMLVLTTMDVQQLPPIQGHPCLTSSLILTSFQLIALKEYVRSRTDMVLQRLITITRILQPLTPEEQTEFKHLIVTYCTFVHTWDDPAITPDTIRILGTRKGVQTAEKLYYDKIRQQGLSIISHRCEDFEILKTSHGSWKSASSHVTKMLNKIVREPEVLQLHKGLIVEVTFNNGTSWSNGQIALIFELPTIDILHQWQPFPILLAPPGIRNLPSNSSIPFLQTLGWKIVNMKTTPENTHHCYKGMFGKRRQYGIRPLAATTVHKAMGNDYAKIVSCVCDDGISGFRLWEKAQVLVLISRVHFTKNIIFVGDKEQTAQTLLDLIMIQPKYGLYMDYLINNLTTDYSHAQFPTINLSSIQPFQLCAAECPKPDETSNGYVYVLISIPNPMTTYIGQTTNLQRRINEHNKGWSMSWTKSITYRPWACLAYVTGFNSSTQRQYLETLWQQLLNQTHPSQNATPTQVLNIGQLAITKYHETYHITNINQTLRFIQIISLNTCNETTQDAV